MGKRVETGFLDRVVTAGSGSHRYQIFVPRNWSRDRNWPVVLFLHGAGERGVDGIVQTEVGIGTAIRRHIDRFPCAVVFPQCAKGASWTAADMQGQAIQAFDDTIREFNGDEARLFLTGISMGGYGCWSLATRQPGRFASVVPICGGVPRPLGTPIRQLLERTMKAVGRTPVWVFHGSNDRVVPVSESRLAVEFLQKAGGDVRYTEYPGVEHNSWDMAYAEPELMPWMLSKREGE
jgi:predicted peptidase